MENESRSDEDDLVLVVRVSTTDGFATNHTYHLSESAQVDLIRQNLENAFVEGTPFLKLANPDVMYRPEHIVRVAFQNELPDVPPDASEDRGPIGFRPT